MNASKPQSHELRTVVEKATVFPSRARVIRGGLLTLPAGATKVKLTGLPDNLIPHTFRVVARAKDAVRILDVKTQTEHYTAFPSENVEYMNQKVLSAKEALQMVDDQLAILEKKRGFLDQIRVQTADQIGKDLDIKRPTISDWQNVLDFLGDNHHQLDTQKYLLTRQRREKEAEWNKLKQDLNQLANALKKSRLVGTVALENTAEQEIRFEVEYQVQEASWAPYYDVRAQTDRGKVQLAYYGEVTQRTGEDWEGVEVRLSTARPNLGTQLPKLHKQVVRKWVDRSHLDGGGAMPAPVMRSAAKKMKSKDEEEVIGMDEMAISAAPDWDEAEYRDAEVEGGQGASVVFWVPGQSDVPGDGTVSRLRVMEEEFDAEFLYSVVPKLDTSVYLEAKIKNPTEYPMLAGPMQVFRNGDFVSTTQLEKLIMPDQTFPLPLGVEEGIAITHKFSEVTGKDRGLLNKTRAAERVTDIVAENLLRNKVTLVVRDQIPVSKDEVLLVKIEQITPSENPQKDKDELAEGVVEWKVEIQPAQKAKFHLQYEIEAPSKVEWEII